MPDSQPEIRSAATVQDGSLYQATAPEDGLEIRSGQDGSSYVEGYIATNESYPINGDNFDEELWTEEALRSVADQINNANEELRNAEVAFPNPETVEKTTGNLEHQNTEQMASMIPSMADTKTVPALEFTEAAFDGFGTKVRARIREEALPDDTVEAVKENIRQGILSAFSIEFKNARSKFVEKGGKMVRKVKDAVVGGAGLTAAPYNDTAKLTDAELRSVMADESPSYDELKKNIKEEIRDEMGIETRASKAGVTYSGTKGGKLDESEIPDDDFEQHYLFPADTKSESSYPVVDADGNLRRGNVEAAHSLGARGGVDASELERKLKELNQVFDSPPIDFKEGRNKDLNDTMSDDTEEAGDGAGESDGSDEPEEEQRSQVEELRNSLNDLKETVEEVRSKNDELEEENEELRNELEDLEELKEVRSELQEDIDSVEEELSELRSDDQPVSDPDEQKNETEDQTPRELRSAGSDYIKENRSVLADKYDMTKEEVMNHA